MSGIRPEILAAHKATWFVYSGPYGEKERLQSGRKYYGMGYDAACSCGWDSRTGGATRRSVRTALEDHRWDEQWAADNGLPCADSSKWPDDVRAEFIRKYQEKLRADADAEHALESLVS